MPSARFIPIVLTVGLALTACTSRKTVPPRTFIPPPPHPLMLVVMTVPEIPEPPALDLKLDAKIGTEAVTETPVPIPPLPGPPVRRPVVQATPRPVAPPPQPAETLPAPRLGQIFTAEQLRDYNRSLEDSLERVRKALGVMAAKNLSPEQAATADRIRTFQKQAEQAREQDLVTAVSLARRADLLAQDLLGRLP